MEAITQATESAPGWEQQQQNEARRFESEAGFSVPGNMNEAHGRMEEIHNYLIRDILRLALAVTEHTGIRVCFEWGGRVTGLQVRYYLPGADRAGVHDIWFGSGSADERTRKLREVQAHLSRLSRTHGTA